MKDEGDLLNTYIFFPVEIGGIDDLIIDSIDKEMSRLRKDLDEIKEDAEK